MSLAPPAATVTSLELCDLIDISYRQLDYLCRTVLRGHGEYEPGSGRVRRFDPELVDRLRIARLLHQALPFSSMDRDNSMWPAIAGAAIAGPRPPRCGFVTMDHDGTVRYFERLDWSGDQVGTLIVPYTLD